VRQEIQRLNGFIVAPLDPIDVELRDLLELVS
jgi:hypothetical protein